MMARELHLLLRLMSMIDLQCLISRNRAIKCLETGMPLVQSRNHAQCSIVLSSITGETRYSIESRMVGWGENLFVEVRRLF